MADWVDIKKQKPDIDGHYLVTIEAKYFADDTTYRAVAIKPFSKEINGFWGLQFSSEWKSEVVAWQHLPEIYNTNRGTNTITLYTLCKE